MLHEWINIVALGAILGAVGQAARGVVGWKKIFDEAQSMQTTATAIFSSSRLVISLIVGAVAGVLSAVLLVDDPGKFVSGQTPSQFKQFLLTLVATGYAGTDFIEGFVRNRYSPASAPVVPPKPLPQPPAVQPLPKS